MHLRSSLQGLSAEKIAILYLGFGVAWIAVTDTLVMVLVESAFQRAWFQTAKGWIFVAMSAIVVFILVSVRDIQIRHAANRLGVALEQLQVTQRVFRHNIRNELTVIRGYTQALGLSIDDEDAIEELHRVDNAAERIEQLSEKLQVVELPGAPRKEDLDLVSTITEVADAEGLALSIEMEMEDPTITGGESMVHLIRHILTYLGERQDDESPQMSVRIKRRAERLTLTFEAMGRPIPASELEPIEVAEERPLFHASGVDLWVIKWLANYHAGDVEIESDDGRNRFVVTLPVSRSWPWSRTRHRVKSSKALDIDNS